MRDCLSFYLNGELQQLHDVPPTLTLLRYLREDQKLCGTKEGCAEGDCGACTVMVSSRRADGTIKREAINSCIRFMPSLDGTSITTVDSLVDSGRPHPVQMAMIEENGSQCGFCTPGFIMSLYTAFRNGDVASLASSNDLLAGNLCRCTGYGPILTAAMRLGQEVAEVDQAQEDDHEEQHLAGLDHSGLVTLRNAGGRAYLPKTADQLAQVYAENPEAVLVAGATDTGLWVTKQHRTLPVLIFMSGVSDLGKVQKDSDVLTVGANVTLTDAWPALADLAPDLGELVRRFAGVQIRNTATVVGNIANGSPIGDLPPAFIALGATLTLRQQDSRRTLPLEDYFIGYGVQDRKPGEFVESITIPVPAAPDQLKCYKISKRFDQDISAICGCFNVQLTDNVVESAVIAFGGMAATPKRARAVENALLGNPWTRQTIARAMDAFPADFAPISDMRASAAYRLKVAQNLLLRYFIEGRTPLSDTRLVGNGSRWS